MPTFELTGPDGAKYTLDAPDENSALSAFRKATGAGPAQPSAPRPEDTEVSASNVVRSIARGVPILGGLADKANAATNAALAPLVDPLLPDSYEKLPEGSFSERYKHALEIQNRKDAGFDAAHPVVSTGAKIAGGMAAFGGALKAAPQLAKPLGFEGTLPQMVTRGASSGALISGADAATRGEDVGKGAAVGLVTGAAAPLVGLAIGKGVQKVKEAVRGKPPLVPELTVDVAGVKVPLPNRAPAAADQVEIARRGGFGEAARDVVAKGDAAAQEALDAAKGNIASAIDPGGAVPPQNAAERVASELRAAEARRFGTEQAAAGRAAQDVATARQAVAGRAPVVAGPEAAAESISADLRALEARRAATEAATARNVTAGTEALRRQAGAVSPEIPPQVLAESPGAAAETIGAGVRGRAAAARQAYNANYEAARAMDSEFAPGSFRPVGQTIRQRLNLGDSPVRADDRTTPFAVRALEDLDTNIGLGNFQNEAAPAVVGVGGTTVPRETASDAALAAEKLMAMGVPRERAMAQAAGKKISLDDVDAARKRLVTFYRDARSADPQGADARATRRILNEFDQYVIDLVGSPKYKGDPAALDTLLEARRGVAEYKSTFGAAGPGDEVGRNVEKILGRYPGQEATADQIAQMSYGPRGEPGGAQAVKVSQRLRAILGETSPEWGAYKQGLLSHLIDTPPGGKPLTPVQQADRLDAFLNGTKGRPLAQVVLSPEERAAWANHAQALRASQPVPLSSLDDTEKLIARISGRDGSAPPSPSDVAELLYGRMGTDRGQSIALVQRLRQTFGADSEQFSAIKQGMVQRVIDGKPGEALSPAQQADRLDSFLSSSMSKAMLNDGERGHLETAARSLRAAEPASLKGLDTVDKVLARITGRDGSPPASLNDVTDYFFGPSSGKRSLQFQLATRLKRELSDEGWNALRVGMWSKLTGVTEGKTELTPKRLSDNIFDFINGPGSDLAKTMFSASERAEMLKFAEAVKAHIPVPGSTNPSGTAPMLAKMANKAGHAILPTIGFAHGGLPGALVGVGADKALSSAKSAMAANRIGLLYYGKQPKVPDDPRLAIAAAVFARSLPQGQSAGNR